MGSKESRVAGTASRVGSPSRLSASAMETVILEAGAPTEADPDGGATAVLLVIRETSWEGATACPCREIVVLLMPAGAETSESAIKTSWSESGGWNSDAR